MTRLRALLVTTAVLLLGGCSFTARMPTDGELVERFHEHRTELHQLVMMFQADKGLGRVGENFTRPDDPSTIGVSPARISEYRHLCAVVGARACIEGYDAEYYTRAGVVPPAGVSEGKNAIWIYLASYGLSFSGGGKGYLYSFAPGFEVVPDTDHTQPLTVRDKGTRTWIHHMEGPWYVFSQATN